MKPEKITVLIPLPKRRAGVLPTKKERDKTDYVRKGKHPKKEQGNAE